jgi:hypothetical protein
LAPFQPFPQAAERDFAPFGRGHAVPSAWCGTVPRRQVRGCGS